MKLEVGTFSVKEMVFSSRTRWSDGALEVDKDELLRLLREDSNVGWVDVQVAKPGEPVRIVRIQDVIEPKAKAGGDAVTYPGVVGRSTNLVGRGRTHRLGGMTIMVCGEIPRENADGTKLWAGNDFTFVDMSGPGAVTPYAETINLCISLESAQKLHSDDWNRMAVGALLKASDYLARAVEGQQQPERQVYDTDRRDPSLPGVVFMPVLASVEYRLGPFTVMGPGVYGVTRLTQPWLLHPTEVMDGAVFGAYNENFTWPLTNTIVPYMCSRHGIDFNFIGVVVVRSNWESQAEKQLMANRAAQLALDAGAQGVIVTTNWRGQRFAETALTVQACERAGLKTVLMTQEEDNERGTAPPLLVAFPEIVAAVSTGTGGVDTTFSPVQKVIGLREPPVHWSSEKPAIHGRYGVDHMHDLYGYGKQGVLDFWR
ncbi:MAG: glycine/sarcosine/betaine reductase component B subunit [Chloroflexota bacterium]|nr:glycine/sarcosine/betaine reductase component B subunit [Chloroflexota bacterium]